MVAPVGVVIATKAGIELTRSLAQWMTHDFGRVSCSKNNRLQSEQKFQHLKEQGLVNNKAIVFNANNMPVSSNTNAFLSRPKQQPSAGNTPHVAPVDVPSGAK